MRVASYEKPDVTLDLYGWTQPRFTFVPPPLDTAGFVLEQTRIGAIGGFGKWGRVQTEIDLGPILGQSAFVPSMLDAYAVFTPYRSRVIGVDVTLGKFRVPFSRQNLIQPVGLQLPDMASFVRLQGVMVRPLGAMLATSFLDSKIRLSAGAFNGMPTGLGTSVSLPARGAPWFFYVGRLEVEPLGPAPRFEGDVRPVAQRRRPVLSFGASVLDNQLTLPATSNAPAVDFHNIAAGADVGVWFAGASLYGELLYSDARFDRPLPADSSGRRVFGCNVQAGYLPPLPFLREHVEIVARIEFASSQSAETSPEPHAIDAASFTWAAGLNLFVDRGHLLKMQIFFQGDQYNDDRAKRLTLQATAGF